MVLRIFTTLMILAAFVSAAGADTKVLVIGDSHTVGDFGSGLVESLRGESGVQVSVEASCGSRPAHFMGVPYRNSICSWDLGYDQTATGSSKNLKSGSRPMKSLPELIAERTPDLVVIAHGTNMYPMKSSKSSEISEKELNAALTKSKSEIERIVSIVAARRLKCVWVGPPSEKAGIFSETLQDRFQTLFEKIGADHGCRFVNSRAITNAKDTARDTVMHIHYYGPAGLKWGTDVGAEILNSLRETAKAAAPDTGRAPAKAAP